MSTPVIYDCKGIPILPGDVLKVFHFRAPSRREKRYMYKLAMGWKKGFMRIKHLSDMKATGYLFSPNEPTDGIEIIEGYGQDGTWFKNRTKKPKIEAPGRAGE